MLEPNNVKRKLAQTMRLPEETIMDSPVIRIVSNMEVVVENHKGIFEFTNETLKIKTAIGLIKISGRTLFIGEIDQHSISVKGQIHSLEYV